MAFTPFIETDQPTMAAFNEKFQGAIEESLLRGAKVISGSYTGTGTYGESNPTTIQFEKKPGILIVAGDYSYVIGVPSAEFVFNVSGSLALTTAWGDNSVEWYAYKDAYQQLNSNGKSYNYFLIYSGGET